MHYFKPLQARGDAVFGLPVDEKEYPELDATDPVMLKTSMQDINKEWLYEGDFVECGIQTSYGLIKDSGVVIWRADIGSFTINIKTPYENQTQFQVVDVIKKGNIYENPELLKNDKTSITKE